MKLVVALSVILLVAWKVFSADKNSQNSITDTCKTQDLGVIIVSAAAKSEKNATVNVIDKETLLSTGAVNVADALGLIPGVGITVGQKNEAKIMIRGVSAERVLLMIDGRPINMPYYGSLDLKTVQLDNISQIQVSKGTPSLLYGVNGCGGVVNIISESFSGNDQFSVGVKAGLGDVLNRRILSDVGIKKNNIELKTTFSGNISDGYRLSDKFASPLGIEDGGVRDNSDVKQYNLTGKVKYDFTDKNSAAITGGYFTSNKGIPSPTDFAQFRRFRKWQRYFTDFTGSFLISSDLRLKSKVYYDNFKNERRRKLRRLRGSDSPLHR